MIAQFRSMIRWCLRPVIRFAWGDWMEYGHAIYPMRVPEYPEFVGVMINDPLCSCVFLDPDDARRLSKLIMSAAYDAQELIPVGETAGA